jgi:hypothetical protein
LAGVFRPAGKEGKNTMKKTLISLALAVVAPFAWAQVSETTTTTTTTEGNGTITEYTPGSVIVLKETSGPRTYHFGKTVTYVTRSGKVLDADTVRTRIKVGIPVRVHYVGTGDAVMVLPSSGTVRARYCTTNSPWAEKQSLARTTRTKNYAAGN